MALDEKDRIALAYCEQNWMAYSKIPTPEGLYERFGGTLKQWSIWLSSSEIHTSFDGRGIPWAEASQLTPQQLAVANDILNLSDNRSSKKKLQDHQISPKQFEGWKRQPQFAAYLRMRSEQLLGEGVTDAHLSLVDNVKAGDLPSIKLLYEMTGRHSSASTGIDIGLLMTRILEIISVHIQNPDILKAIAADFSSLDKPRNNGEQGMIVQGELITNEAPVAGPLHSPAQIGLI